MKLWFKTVVLVGWCVGAVLPLRAQLAVPPPMPMYQSLSADDLDQLLGPIALYPDPLIAQILPASTVPTQIVLADRYVSSGGSLGQIEEQPWTASVQALAHYPEVLRWMDDNLNWTTELGQAFLNQPQDVMDAIQRLRQSALNLGNLQSTPQQQVINDGGYIEIVPVDAQVIYVPVYQPAQVYYQTSYGASWITFGAGFAIGTWLDCDFDWGHHNIVVWNRAHPRPVNWWHQPARQRDFGHVTVWHPAAHPAAVNVRGDRGWDAPHNQSVVVATVSHSVSDSAMPRRSPMPAATPASAKHEVAPNPPASNGAFIGIQSSQQARNYSKRGEQSMHEMSHAAPPPGGSHPNHGANENHGSNQKKH